MVIARPFGITAHSSLLLATMGGRPMCLWHCLPETHTYLSMAREASWWPLAMQAEVHQRRTSLQVYWGEAYSTQWGRDIWRLQNEASWSLPERFCPVGGTAVDQQQVKNDRVFIKAGWGHSKSDHHLSVCYSKARGTQTMYNYIILSTWAGLGSLGHPPF